MKCNDPCQRIQRGAAEERLIRPNGQVDQSSPASRAHFQLSFRLGGCYSDFRGEERSRCYVPPGRNFPQRGTTRRRQLNPGDSWNYLEIRNLSYVDEYRCRVFLVIGSHRLRFQEIRGEIPMPTRYVLHYHDDGETKVTIPFSFASVDQTFASANKPSTVSRLSLKSSQQVAAPVFRVRWWFVVQYVQYGAVPAAQSLSATVHRCCRGHVCAIGSSRVP